MIQFSGIVGRSVHFYGNDGVCIFKYLVTRDDPQWIFSTSILLINCSCFLLIAASYTFIGYKTSRSGRNVGNNVNNQDRGPSKLQKKISAIILTDFFCWIPLSTISLLHLFEVFEATSWYPIFSILILPINSAINPLLYNSSFLFKVCCTPFQVAAVRVQSLRTTVTSVRATRSSNQQETGL